MDSYGSQHAVHGAGRYDDQLDANMYQVTQPPLGSSGAATHGTNAGGQTAPPNAAGMPRPHESQRPAFNRQASDLYAHQPQQGYTNHDPQRPSGSLGLPGVLQPGPPRPAAVSANTAPSSVPQLPPIASQAESYHTSPRGSTTHNYSRSSPDPRYPTTPSRPYMSSQTPQNAPFSPLGLADIRGVGENTAEDPQSAYPYDGSQPGNCQYLAPWPVYAFDWCKWPVQYQGHGDSAGKMAIGSYLEDGHNYIQVLDTRIVPEQDPEQAPGASQYSIEYVRTAEASHSYPVTRLLWEPQSARKKSCDLLATSGDHLRLWSLPQGKSDNYGNSITSPSNQRAQDIQKLSPLALLSNSKSPEHTAPLTSLDWNTLSPSLIITSSIDTTCTIWDIPSLTAKTQLIAHDKEVFDVRFCANSVDVFVSCGADGSVRMFDLRSLEHSTIIYEPSEKDHGSKSSPDSSSPTKNLGPSQPLLRLAASPYDAHLLATFSADSPLIRILDVRQPGQALLELQGHQASLNCIEWSPTCRGMLASGADDSLVLVWDLLNSSSGSGATNGGGTGTSSDAVRQPAMSWTCDQEVNNLSWAPQSGLSGQGGSGEWLGVSGGRGVWGINV